LFARVTPQQALIFSNVSAGEYDAAAVRALLAAQVFICTRHAFQNQHVGGGGGGGGGGSGGAGGGCDNVGGVGGGGNVDAFNIGVSGNDNGDDDDKNDSLDACGVDTAGRCNHACKSFITSIFKFRALPFNLLNDVYPLVARAVLILRVDAIMRVNHFISDVVLLRSFLNFLHSK
jgi:hypothetical protein